MTVKELIRELNKYPQDAEAYVVNDWDAVDEDGHFANISDVTDVTDDVVVIDMGMDFEDEHRIIICY